MSIEKSNSDCRDGSRDLSEPVAKRTRYANKKREQKKQEDEDKSNYEPTVLDILNEDCWRIILDYVKLQDLVRSERVSRRWRLMVQRYYQGIRLRLQYGNLLHELNVPPVKNRTMSVPTNRFARAVAKFGRAVVAADCRGAAEMRALSRHCPKIEELMIRDYRFQNLNDKVIPFNKLRRICVYGYSLDDDCVSKLLRYSTIEELVVNNSYALKGSCIRDLKTNLKSLDLQSCIELEIDHLIASERLSELTKLELSSNTKITIQNLHKLIEKTPKLEYLGLRSFHASSYTWPDTELVDAICRLSVLKHLNLFNNSYVNNKWLEGVGRCCRQLQTVSVGNCKGVTGEGVVALCRGAGKTLTALDACSNERVTFNDVATCIRHCPNLEIFNARNCPGVAENLHVIEAAVIQSSPRTRPLRLQLTKKRPDDDDSDEADGLDDSFDFPAFDESDEPDDSAESDESDDFYDNFNFFGDSDLSDDSDEPESPPMETCSDLILDYKDNTFKCGDSALSEWENAWS